MEAVCAALTALLGPGGVLVLDDLQWSDSASLDMIGYLLRRHDRFPVFSMLIWRTPSQDSGSLRRLVEEMEGAGHGAVIDLAPLSDDEVRELTARVSPDLANSTVSRIVEDSDGNPLVAVQYLRMVDEHGVFQEDLVRGEVAEARLRGVSDLGRQLLAAASVVGREFDPAEVKAASGRTDDEAAQALEELLAAGLVRETPAGLLDFSHDAVRHHVRQSLSAIRRRLLNGRLADHLTTHRHRDQLTLSGRIAQHLEEAGRLDEAAIHRMAAGEGARAVFAHAEALAHYQAALALGHPDASAIHVAIGDLQTLEGDYSAALDSYRTAAARAEGHRLADIEHRLGEINGRLGRWELALHHFEAAEEGLAEPAALVDLYTDWARLARRMGDDGRARQLVGRAADTTGTSAARRPMIVVMQGVCDEDPGRGERRLEEGLAMAREGTDPGAEAAALTALALIARKLGRTDEAIERAGSALALVERIGDRHRQAALHDLLADLFHEAGDESAAMGELTKAVQIFAEVGTGSLEPEIWRTAPW